jgi:hypothetical protein
MSYVTAVAMSLSGMPGKLRWLTSYLSAAFSLDLLIGPDYSLWSDRSNQLLEPTATQQWEIARDVSTLLDMTS